MNNMVLRQRGRLCNQLLGRMFLLYVCKKHGLDFNIVSFHTSEYIWEREEFFSRFLKYERIVSDGDYIDLSEVDGVTITGKDIQFPYLRYEVGVDETIVRTIQEHNLSIGKKCPSFIFPTLDFMLDGGQLFLDMVDNTNTMSRMLERYPSIEQGAIGLHFRRTDLIKNHVEQSNNKQMGIFKEHDGSNEGCTFLIFSDDIAWCKKNMWSSRNKVVFVEGNRDYEDFIALSLCDNVSQEPINFKHASTFI